MKILLYYPIKDNILEIDEKNIIDEMYNNLAILPTEKQLIKLNIPNPKKYIKNQKIYISKLSYKIPLFDYITKNIYLVEKNDVYIKVIQFNYRFFDSKIYNLLLNTISKLKKIKIKIEWVEKYIEKLNKNINFLNNYNLKILKNTYLDIFLSTNPSSKEITTCIKPSFLPYQYYQSPYYTKSELISMGLNLDIIQDLKSPWNYTDIELKNLCDKLLEYELDTQMLIKNQLYILYNNAKSYVQFYTLFGSYFFNNYMRNKKSIKDNDIECHINNFLHLIQKCPSFINDYEVYRFIEDDHYLNYLNIGDILIEESFISTTRNPFYSEKNNNFGFILIKIKIPKNKQGIALLLESYSNYPYEQEIILPPSKLKLVNINKDFKYYHWDKKSENKIKKKYIFEYVEPLSYDISFYTSNYTNNNIVIPNINFYKMDYFGSNINDKIINFINDLPKINLRRVFTSNIGKTEYTFYVYYLTKNKIYHKFFFLQNEDNNNIGDEIYITIQNPNNGNIELIIEIRTIISVNYYFRYSGQECNISDDDLLFWLSGFAKSLNIFTVIIHANYNSYISVVEKILNYKNLLEDFKYIQEIDNPDSNILNIYTADINTYCTDLIDYIFNNNIRFNNISYIKRKVPLHMIDKLKTIKFIKLYNDHKNKISGLDDLFKSFDKLKDLNITIYDFYKIIHINYPYLIQKLQNLILFIYPKDSPLPWHFYYIFKPYEFLYEKGLIPFIIVNKDNIEDIIKKLENEVKFIHDNKFRQIIY